MSSHALVKLQKHISGGRGSSVSECVYLTGILARVDVNAIVSDDGRCGGWDLELLSGEFENCGEGSVLGHIESAKQI